MMRYVLFCPDGLLEDVAGTTTLPGDPPVYLVARPTLRARLTRAGGPVLVGDIASPEAYTRASKGHRGPIVVQSRRQTGAPIVAPPQRALSVALIVARVFGSFTLGGHRTPPTR